MPKTTTKLKRIPLSYIDLCKELFYPRPIHDSVDYKNAAAAIDAIVMLQQLTPDQADYLEAISTFVEKFDQDLLNDSLRGSVIDTLKFLMEARDLSASDLGRILGNRSLGAAILRGDRGVSKAHAIRLGEYFKVGPGLFIE